MELEIDNTLINSCLRKIEDQLGWGDSQGWSTQDFESLSKKIQEATGVALSVATLKRIWGKVRYESKPTITTLNALAQYLGYENWLVFKQKNANAVNGSGHYKNSTDKDLQQKRPNNKIIAIISLTLVAVLAYLFYPITKATTTLNPDDFKFSSKKVVGEGVPNSVIFEYDATAAGPDDSIFIQQSWDKRLSTQVARDQHQHTSIYYHPGFFEAKLRINQTVVKEHNLFITTKGWTSMVDLKPVPVYFKEDDVKSNGHLGIAIEQLQLNNIHLQPHPPYVAYYNMGEFGDAQSDDLVVESSFRNSYAEGANVCQFTEIRIQFAGGALIIPLSAKGCVSALKFMNLGGKKTDLSALGCDFTDWVNFKLTIHPDSFVVHIKDNEPLEFPIDFKPRKFVGIGYTFQGTGQVDFIRISNQAGKIYYEENF